MKKRGRLCGIGVFLIFLTVVLSSAGAFGETGRNEVMDSKCAASKEGTERDIHIKKVCAAYFEETGANVVTGVVASAGSAISSGERFRTAAAVAVGVSTLAGVLATGIVWDTFSALMP